MCGTDTGGIIALSVYVILGFYNVRSFAHTVKIVGSYIVLRTAIVAPMISADLSDWLQAGGSLVLHLHEVIVAIGLDGDAYRDFVAHLKSCGVFLAIGR